MVRDQLIGGPGIVEWSLPEDEIGPVQVIVPLHDDELEPDGTNAPWCPVCGTRTRMRAAVTPRGRRFDFCADCGLLWHVDRRLGRAEGHRVAAPGPASPARTATADVRRGAMPSEGSAAAPGHPDGRRSEPLAS